MVLESSSFVAFKNPFYPPHTTYHHHGVLVNGRMLICNDSQIDNCVRQCARQFPPMDQRDCVNAVEAKWAPYSYCFSAESTVVAKGRNRPRALRELHTGDYVLDADLRFTRVVGWLHRDEKLEADFLRLTHASGELFVTEDHMLFCSSGKDYIPAKFVRSLETIYVDGSMVRSEILQRDVVRKTGVFAPLTESGSLLVSGVHASCFASPSKLGFSVSQTAAQVAMTPYRLMPAAALPDLETYSRTLFHIFSN